MYRLCRWYLAGLPVLWTNIFWYGSFTFNPNNKRYWDCKLSEFDEFWRNEHYYYIIDLLPPIGEFSLLDIGCALGDGCELLQEKFPEARITGVDISVVGIEKARNKTKKVEYFVCDVLREPLRDTYDYITIVETLEHFDDPFLVIDKLLNSVNNSIIISVPYTPNDTGHRSWDEHRYAFNENTFVDAGYDCRIAVITDFIKATGHKCIIFEIFK